MTDTKNARLSKTYVDNAVDAAMDAQRQYSEELFSRADKRVRTQFEELEVKMKTALTTLRPEEQTMQVEEMSTTMPIVERQNSECLEVLKRRMAALVMQYELATGLRVRCVYFEKSHGYTIVKPLVHNI